MLFGLKNVPLMYQRVVNLAFQEYLGVFMKLFLDDLNVFNEPKCIWKNCNCVLTNAKNLILALTLKNACFLCIQKWIWVHRIQIGKIIESQKELCNFQHATSKNSQRHPSLQ
jgi:hypothetical protein